MRKQSLDQADLGQSLSIVVIPVPQQQTTIPPAITKDAVITTNPIPRINPIVIPRDDKEFEVFPQVSSDQKDPPPEPPVFYCNMTNPAAIEKNNFILGEALDLKDEAKKANSFSHTTYRATLHSVKLNLFKEGFLKMPSSAREKGLETGFNEVISSDIARYFYSIKKELPLCELVKDEKNNYWVFSLAFKGFAQLATFKEEPLKNIQEAIDSGEIQGLAKLAIINLLIAENDAHEGNVIVVKIDEKTRQLSEFDRGQASNHNQYFVSQGKNFIPSTRDLEYLPFLFDFSPHNWFGLIARKKYLSESPFFTNQILANPIFRKELNEALLALALWPDCVIERMVEKKLGSRAHRFYKDKVEFYKAQREHIINAALGVLEQKPNSFRFFLKNYSPDDAIDLANKQMRDFSYLSGVLFEQQGYAVALEEIRQRAKNLFQVKLLEPAKPIITGKTQEQTTSQAESKNVVGNQNQVISRAAQETKNCRSRCPHALLVGGTVFGGIIELTLFYSLQIDKTRLLDDQDLNAFVVGLIEALGFFVFSGLGNYITRRVLERCCPDNCNPSSSRQTVSSSRVNNPNQFLESKPAAARVAEGTHQEALKPVPVPGVPLTKS